MLRQFEAASNGRSGDCGQQRLGRGPQQSRSFMTQRYPLAHVRRLHSLELAKVGAGAEILTNSAGYYNDACRRIRESRSDRVARLDHYVSGKSVDRTAIEVDPCDVRLRRRGILVVGYRPGILGGQTRGECRSKAAGAPSRV